MLIALAASNPQISLLFAWSTSELGGSLLWLSKVPIVFQFLTWLLEYLFKLLFILCSLLALTRIFLTSYFFLLATLGNCLTNCGQVCLVVAYMMSCQKPLSDSEPIVALVWPTLVPRWDCCWWKNWFVLGKMKDDLWWVIPKNLPGVRFINVAYICGMKAIKWKWPCIGGEYVQPKLLWLLQKRQQL